MERSCLLELQIAGSLFASCRQSQTPASCRPSQGELRTRLTSFRYSSSVHPLKQGARHIFISRINAARKKPDPDGDFSEQRRILKKSSESLARKSRQPRAMRKARSRATARFQGTAQTIS